VTNAIVRSTGHFVKCSPSLEKGVCHASSGSHALGSRPRHR